MDKRRGLSHSGILPLAFLAAALALLCTFGPANTFAEGAGDKPEDLVRVLYFHGDFRCVNCHNIEQYTRETVENYFKKELDSGRITFQAINVESAGNEHFAEDYGLYTKSVVLSLMKGGKEARFYNLPRIWELLRDKEAFQQYVKGEIEKYLKEL